MTIGGVVIALALLALILVVLWWSWRHPFVGIGFLVAGMAFHSFVIMVLLRLGTPALLVRAVQGWKELLLLVLFVVAARGLWAMRGSAWREALTPVDWLVAAFALLAIIYFLLPSSLLHSGANLQQRLVGFRVVFMIPLLYFLGRTLKPAGDYERMSVVWLGLGAAGVMTLFGIFELFFIPTRTWIDWGVNLYSSFLGFTYHGPSGMPENFFLTLPDDTLVRRMVSTYVSPLGIAYTALLLFPMGIVVIDRRVPPSTARWIGVLTSLVVLGVLLTITRLALFSLIGEIALMWLLFRRSWMLALVPVVVVAAVIVLYPYTSIAPAVDRNLNPVHRTGLVWAISGNDSSTREHWGYLVQDLKVDLQHPLGLGTGASTIRYGSLVGTGESAVLGVFGDLGLLGGLIYVAIYLLVLWQGWQAISAARAPSLAQVMPVVALVGGLGIAPITLTSDVWGDLSVTFLFWWAAGATASLATQTAAARARAGWTAQPAATVT
ncbi:MAG TPA: hypothetical protein VM674_04520 [Candidatus Acidoferrum sp.]|nr:hypothetical protein [Candidatus Acidoferrum sp.]